MGLLLYDNVGSTDLNSILLGSRLCSLAVSIELSWEILKILDSLKYLYSVTGLVVTWTAATLARTATICLVHILLYYPEY